MKKILITGASGMLGARLVVQLTGKYDIYAIGGSDFTENKAENYRVFDLRENNYEPLKQWIMPEIIIHCAAITDVDYCEKNTVDAFEVNANSVSKLMKCYPASKIIYISTDAVFSDKDVPKKEQDTRNPLNNYGRTKKQGEDILLHNINKNSIIRTTIVGKNINSKKKSFVEWIVDSLKNKKKITMFKDVMFSPISTTKLASEIDVVVERELCGVYHISGRECVSKYEFGQIICMKMAFDKSLIEESSIRNHNFNAKRALNQCLDSSYYERVSLRKMPKIDETITELTMEFNNN